MSTLPKHERLKKNLFFTISGWKNDGKIVFLVSNRLIKKYKEILNKYNQKVGYETSCLQPTIPYPHLIFSCCPVIKKGFFRRLYFKKRGFLIYGNKDFQEELVREKRKNRALAASLA